VAELKPCYLIWGDDDVMLDAWRARVRVRAAEEGPNASLEVLGGDRVTGEAVANAVSAMTLSVGRRFVLADGVERWREADAKAVAPAVKALPPDTVLVLVAAGKAPAALGRAIERAGGAVHHYEAPKGAGWPTWIAERAGRMGIGIDRDAAQAIAERVGYDEDVKPKKPRLQRAVRELEKLKVFVGEAGRVDLEAVERATPTDVDPGIYKLADAVIAQDPARALEVAEDLRDRGYEMMHILFALLRRLHDCRRAWALLSAGKSANEIQSELRVSPWAAKQIAKQVRSAEPEQFERALELLADLDYQIRGGGNLDADSALTLTLAQAAGALEPHAS
jgi:DNA polymerase-3 subunit delta